MTIIQVSDARWLGEPEMIERDVHPRCADCGLVRGWAAHCAERQGRSGFHAFVESEQWVAIMAVSGSREWLTDAEYAALTQAFGASDSTQSRVNATAVKQWLPTMAQERMLEEMGEHDRELVRAYVQAGYSGHAANAPITPTATATPAGRG